VPSPRSRPRRGRHAEAAAAWTALGCPYEAAVALADSSDPDDLRSAFVTFGGLEALRWSGAANRLRAAGQTLPCHASATSDAVRLDRRAVDVALLLAEGLTNSEIAERLYIAPKTVDHHVSNVLAKLGVPTRRRGARVGRLGLGGR
jgi:DNA-binding NarL/FixJ family response regulator